MDILYLATFDPTVGATGTSTRGRLFLEHLVERHRVHLVHLREPDREGRDSELEQRLASLRRIDHGDLRYFLWCPELYAEAARVLEETECSLIFADFEKAGLYAALLSSRYDVPYLYSSHNVEYRRYVDLARDNPLRLPFVPYLYCAERIACRGACTTIAISYDDGAVFESWIGEDRLAVLPCAFDGSVYRPRRPVPSDDVSRGEGRDGGGNEVVLLVGNYRNAGNRQGARILVEEVRPRVLRERPDVTFRCVGKHFPEELCREGVSAPGFVEDLLSEYRRADVVVAPVLMGGGIKIKVIEALACGKPLVATPKALEGIGGTDLEHVFVTPAERFAETILQVLEEKPGETRANWEVVRDRFGTRRQLTEVDELISRCAKDPGAMTR